MLDDLCEVIRFDHRGCGRSDKAEPYTLETCLEDLHAIRHHYGVDRWIMVGHSFGADLSLAYSMRYPEHVHGFICLFGTGAPLPNCYAVRTRRKRYTN